MQMRNKDMVQPGEFQSGFTKLQLGAFPTVYHKQLITHVHYLRSGEMACGRQCGAAAEDVYVKFFHNGAKIIKAPQIRKQKGNYGNNPQFPFYIKYMTCINTEEDGTNPNMSESAGTGEY